MSTSAQQAGRAAWETRCYDPDQMRDDESWTHYCPRCRFYVQGGYEGLHDHLRTVHIHSGRISSRELTEIFKEADARREAAEGRHESPAPTALQLSLFTDLPLPRKTS